MRSILAALVVAVAVAAGLPAAQPASALSANPKVVIVVGPVGSQNDHYKRDADQVAAEAAKYTNNVVKVYTPNATWSKVKAAMQGASVFVYLGHGNGWPSPYPPFQEQTKNGLGLDPSTGADGTKHVYYGGNYIREYVTFAPNAVVLFYHLCYASGNTEGSAAGIPEGPLSDSKTRVDGYAAAFIEAGARAVFATGHPHHPVTYYISQLFTTRRTMADIFRADPDWNGNLKGPYSSSRTPGMQYQMDPDNPDSGFWRSLAGNLSLTATKVTGTIWAPTNEVPMQFVVPGAAEVTASGGVGLFATAEDAADPAGAPASTLAAATRLRLTANSTTMANGTRTFAATTLDGSKSGFVRATGLAPRDSYATKVWSQDGTGSLLSPNGDGIDETFALSLRLSEPLSTKLVVKNAAGTTVKSITISGDMPRFAWDLRNSSGALVADGTYTWTAVAQDGWGNAGVSLAGEFGVDRTAPQTDIGIEATEGNAGWLRSAAKVTLKATDNVAGVDRIRVSANGADSADYTGPITFSADGEHTIAAWAEDKAKNREANRQRVFRIDATKPDVELVAAGDPGATDGTWRGPVSVTTTASDATSGMAAITATLDGAPVDPGRPIAVEGEGTHELEVVATDVAGNQRTVARTLVIDTTAPVIEAAAAEGSPPTVTPNGDGVRDTVKIPFSVSEPVTVTATIATDAGTTIRTLTKTVDAGDGSVTWDGKTSSGSRAKDGTYAVTFEAVDPTGNVSEPASAAVASYSALSSLTRTPTRFYPQDGDSIKPSTKASFRLLSPATVTITVLDAKGEVVRTGMNAKALAAGTHTWTWKGTRADGSWAPRGTYRIVVAATNGIEGASQSVSVLADAFASKTSVTEAVRGTAFTLTVTRVESLSTTPRVTVTQPGRTPWTITMTRTSTTTWKATITPRSGDPGTLSLAITAKDTAGGTNKSTVRLPLR